MTKVVTLYKTGEDRDIIKLHGVDAYNDFVTRFKNGGFWEDNDGQGNQLFYNLKAYKYIRIREEAVETTFGVNANPQR